MITNPVKSVVINKSIEFLMNRLFYIGGWSGTDKGIKIVEASLDKNLNTYNFKSQANIVGLFSLGNYGIVTLEPNGENVTKLTIEMGKNYGCITDDMDAQDLNMQIQAFLSLLSSLISMDDSNLPNYPKQVPNVKKKKLFGIF